MILPELLGHTLYLVKAMPSPFSKLFLSMVKVQLNTFVQSFRYDNAYELGSSLEATFFSSENGISH